MHTHAHYKQPNAQNVDQKTKYRVRHEIRNNHILVDRVAENYSKLARGKQETPSLLAAYATKEREDVTPIAHNKETA